MGKLSQEHFVIYVFTLLFGVNQNCQHVFLSLDVIINIATYESGLDYCCTAPTGQPCALSSQMVFPLPTNDGHLKYDIQQKSLQDIYVCSGVHHFMRMATCPARSLLLSTCTEQCYVAHCLCGCCSAAQHHSWRAKASVYRNQ